MQQSLAYKAATAATAFVFSTTGISAQAANIGSLSNFLGGTGPEGRKASAAQSWVDAHAAAIRALTPNWDGYGADPIKPSTLDQILQYLKLALPEGGKVGALVPGADGSVQAEWHLKALSIGLLVEEGGAVSCWVRQAGSSDEVEATGLQAVELFRSIARTDFR